MPPVRHILQASPGSGLDDQFPREWTDFRYRVISVVTQPQGATSPTRSFREHTTSFLRRDGAHVAEDLPYPPTPYIPDVPLHAAILSPHTPDPSLDPANPGWPPNQPKPVPATDILRPHSSPGILVFVVFVSAIAALSATFVTYILIKKRAVRIRVPLPAFLQRHSLKQKIESTTHWDVIRFTPSSLDISEKQEEQHQTEWPGRITGLFQYVHITHDGDHTASLESERPESVVLDTPHTRAIPPSAYLSPLARRHSSPSLVSSPPPACLSPSAPRPMSMPPLDPEAALLVRQQKLAEVAQIRRMQVIPGDSSLPSISEQDHTAQLQSLKGLGIVGQEAEEDIGSTALAALQHYKLSTFQSLSNTPAGDLQMGDSASTGLPVATPASSSTLSSLDTFGDSTVPSFFEEDVAEIGTARTQSMEIQQGVLVSFTASTVDVPHLMISTPSTIASRNTQYSPHPQISCSPSSSQDYLRPYSPTPLDGYSSSDALGGTIGNFPSPPPMLGPIVTSPTTFSVEFEKSLEERVASYRTGDSWPRRSLKLGLGETGKRLEALSEALGFGGSVLFDSWPISNEAEG